MFALSYSLLIFSFSLQGNPYCTTNSNDPDGRRCFCEQCFLESRASVLYKIKCSKLITCILPYWGPYAVYFIVFYHIFFLELIT